MKAVAIQPAHDFGQDELYIVYNILNLGFDVKFNGHQYDWLGRRLNFQSKIRIIQGVNDCKAGRKL